jgi:hypothetical protein
MKVASTALVLALAVVLAGCTADAPAESSGQDGPPDVAPPPEFTDDTGALTGQVRDDEGLPVSGADVALGPGDRTARTDAAGGFTFSLLEPGTYELYVAKLGFVSVAKGATVTAGSAATIDVVLEAIPVVEPYSLTWQQAGRLGCAVQVDPVNGLSACGLAAIVTLLTGQDTSNIDDFALFWDIPEPTGAWETGIFEMQWESTQTLGRGLQMIWEVNTCSGDPDLTFGIVVGESPLRLQVDRAQIVQIVNESSVPDNCLAQGIATFDTSGECNEDRCNLQSRVFSAAETTGQDADVGAAIQQPFEQFVTNFYNAPAPADYSALPDQ